MGSIYEVYIDVLAVNNFLIDLAAFMAVNLFLRRRVRAYRILIGVILGTIGSCLAFLYFKNLAAYLLFVHFVLNPAHLVFSRFLCHSHNIQNSTDSGRTYAFCNF